MTRRVMVRDTAESTAWDTTTRGGAVSDARSPLGESTRDAAQLTRAEAEGDAACPAGGVRYPDAAYACVECVTSNDCNDASLPICDPASHRCVACTADGLGCAEGERCSETRGEPSDAAVGSNPRCIECTRETVTADCRAHAPFCVNDRCAVCDPVRGEGCNLATPYCRHGAELSEEWTRASEAGASIDFATAVCVQCRDDDDCVAGKPRCVVGACVE